MKSVQEEITKKQVLLNNFVDRIMDLKQNHKMPVTLSNVHATKRPDLNFMEMFDLLIWIEKKKPQLLLNIIEMDILSSAINLIPLEQMQNQIKSFILLISNCKINGQIIVYMLVNGLVDLVIVNYIKSISSNLSKIQNSDFDQKLQYLGSLLKACNTHVNQKTYAYFMNKRIYLNEQARSKSQAEIQLKREHEKACDPTDIFNTCDLSMQIQDKIEPEQQKQCLLIKICSRFYNCPEQLTKTTVLNILMNILRQPFAKQLIINKNSHQIQPFISDWSKNLCCQFRNELKNFNQQLMVLKSNEYDFFIQQINDKVILWQDLTQTPLKEIYKDNFMHLVIYTLIIGSLNTYSLPMFNIKFTFFILAKMMRICANLNMLPEVGHLLFMKNQVKYSEGWISTAVLKGFDIDHILNDQYFAVDKNEEEQVNTFSGINDFFLNMLKSKDEHFLQISLNMLQQLLLYVKKNKESIEYFDNTLGFGSHGRNLISITSILIGQLRFDHSLNNLKRICQTLIFIHPSKHLIEENANEFVYFYSEFLAQTLDILQKGTKHWNYIIQTFEYDMKILQLIKFVPKSLKDKELLIHPTEHEEQTREINEKQNSQIHQNNPSFKKSFYNMIPQTPSEILRYRIVKTFLFLKFKEMMVQSKENDQILTKYVQKLKAWQLKQLKPGDKIPYPLKQKFYQCKVIEQKTQIPCVVIEDDVNFIVGFVESNHVKIIINVKIKHIQCQIITKKDKTYIQLNISKFDFGCENIIQKSVILIRGFETGIQYLGVKKQNFKEKQMSSIKKGLKKTVENLPQISLL